MIIFLSKSGIWEGLTCALFASISVFHASTNHTLHRLIYNTIPRLAILVMLPKSQYHSQRFEILSCLNLLQPKHCTKPTFSISISMPMSPPASKAGRTNVCKPTPRHHHSSNSITLSHNSALLLSDRAEMTSCFGYTWTHTSNHDSISSIDDLIDVIDALLILNLPEVSDHPICWDHPMPLLD